MNILGIESLIYGAEDVAAATRFFEDWGLEPVATGDHGADFRLVDGTTVLVRHRDDPALPPAAVPGSTARECIWGVDTAASLAAIGAELATDREVTESADGTLHTVDNLGYRIGFRVTARHADALALPETNTVGAPARRDERAASAFAYRVRQRRFSHVVYWAPGDLEKHARFYIDRLAFRLTEEVRGRAKFLRCSRGHDHHNLFLQNGGDNYGFQHAAFEVRDLDEVMMVGNHMEAQGWKSHLGPGRHVLGSNTYWYFWCPAGGMVECGSDIDHITDDWQPKVHDSVPGGGSSWRARASDEGLRPGHGVWPTVRDALTPPRLD